MSEKKPLTAEEVKSINEELRKGNKLLDDRYAKLLKEHEAHKKNHAEALKMGNVQEHAIKASEQALALQQQQLEKGEYRQRQLAKLGDQRTAAQETEYQQLVETNKELQEKIDLESQSIRNQRKMHNLAGDIANTMFGVNKNWKKSWWGQIADGGMSGKLSQLGKSFADAMNPADMLGSTLMKIQESTMLTVLSFDSTTASLAAATGQGTRYNDMIVTISDSSRGMGVGMSEAADAIKGLNDSMSGFSDLSNEAATAMATQTAQLGRLGVSAQQAGKMNDQFMKGMGMTADQAMAVNNDLARTAMGLGIPVAKMSADFEAALPQLAAWGSEAPKIFKKVAAAAKGLGVEMNTLLGFAGQFDTFEGAATAVGKMNNILGGDLLNSYDMINASEEERIRLMLQGVQASGKSWDSMSRFERMALANAAGITDMAEANKLFKGGLSAYDEAQRKAASSAVSQKELEERTAAAVSVQDKMKQIFEAMAVAVAPLVNFMHSLTNAVLAVNDATGGLLVPVILGAIAAYALFYQGMKLLMLGKRAAGLQTKKLTAEEMAATIAKQQQTIAALQEAAAINSSTASKVANSTVTESSIKSSLKDAAATNMSASSKLSESVANNTQTVSQGASNVSKNLGIVATLRLAAATAWNTVKTWASVVAERALTLGRWAMAAAAGFLTSILWGQSAAQSSVAGTALPASGGVAALAAAMAALGTPPAIFAVAAIAALALAMGMAAIAAAVMVFSIVQLVKAFMQMPGAIIPALLGLAAFMAILHIFVISTAALAPVAGAFAASAAFIGYGLLLLAPGLLAFSVSMVVFAAAMNLFSAGSFASMLALSLAIFPFAVAMAYSAPLLLLASVLMAPALVRLGIGFSVLALGLFLMTTMIPSMVVLSGILPMFAWAMFAASIPMFLAAATLPKSAAMIGLGLAVLGLSLMLFSATTAGVMTLLGPALMLFAVSLLVATPFLWLAASTFAPAALLVGIGLGALGLALLLFSGESAKTMALVGLSLIPFAMGLWMASGMMWKAAFKFAPAALIVGIGLGVLGLAIKLFDRKAIKAMTSIPLALIAFSMGLFAATPFLAAAASTFVIPAMLVGAGLAVIGLALKLFNRKSFKAMEGLTIALPIFTASLAITGALLSVIGAPFALGALYASGGLIALGLALRTFPGEGADAMNTIAGSIVPFALALFFATPLMAVIAVPFLKASVLLGAALWILGSGFSVFAEPFRQMAESIVLMAPFASSMVQLAFGLMAIGPALIVFAASMLAVGLIASLPFFSTGLDVFKDALNSMSQSFENIPTEKAKALGDFFSSLASLSNLNNVADVMWAIAGGIYDVSAALAFMPEEKAFALSQVVSSVTEAAVKVTPDKVENVVGLVEQAATYADVQAKFKSPSVDAFVQALKQVNGDSDSGTTSSGKGKDIVLELNGREIGRAIDAHLDDKHNLRS